MTIKEQYINTITSVLDKYFAALKMPLSIIDCNNTPIYCIPTCGDNSWPSKNNNFALEYFYSFSQIKSPTLIIKEDSYYLGVIPLEYNLYITVGPVMPHIYSLSILLAGLSSIYTKEEIITYYNVNSECGFMDNIRFSNIFALICGSILHRSFFAKELFIKRIVINEFPLLDTNVDYYETLNSSAANSIDTMERPSLFYIKCDKYILSHLREKITAAELSTAVNVSERTLYRLFKENFNMTPNDYIQQKRLSKSLEMLNKTDMTISEISSYWGYSSQSHYNKAFEKMYKKTPGEYRKDYR